jgi:hypothetical protein
VKGADVIAHAAEGTRNRTLNAETYALARFITSGDLAEADVFDTLLVAAMRAGLSKHEASKTIASALRARGRAA